MSSTAFALEWHGDVLVARLLRCDLIQDDVDELGKQILHEVDHHHCRKVVLALDQPFLPTMLSSLLGKAIRIHHEMEARGGNLRLCSLPELGQQIIDTTGLKERLEVSQDVASAVAKLNEGRTP